jgi:DNA-directed RNA polymerase specialized sigma24 family protein
MTEGVTEWIERLKAGDRGEAVARLWEAYFDRLVSLARRHLAARPRAAADEEDVALSAFDSFVRAAGAGKFPRLDDRDDLWQVLFLITARKVADRVEADHRQKRGSGRAALPLQPDDGSGLPLPSREPDPAEAAAVAEGLDRLLSRIGDLTLRQVAVWKLEGYTNAEIGERLGRSEVTVERKVRLIRECWTAECGDQN